jgi:LuxR family maltose regulon positive regulatory protein
LLATKLHVPPPRPDLVPRPRLLRRLEEGLHLGHRLTLVSAPAGFGKTTLLSSWVASADRSVAWLSLDEGDNDPAFFWSYVVAALQTVRADVGQTLLAALRAPQHPPIESLLVGPLRDQAALHGLLNKIRDMGLPLLSVERT